MNTTATSSVDPGLLRATTAFRKECKGRRVHPTTFRVGVLGGQHVQVPHDPTDDTALRTDLLEQILAEVDLDATVFWLTRGGELAPGDVDFGWCASAREAFGRYGHTMRFFPVITRNGWFDLLA